MDKHNGHRISIKINGEDRTFVENKTKNVVEQYSPYKNDEIAAAKEHAADDEEFSWVLPEEEQNEDPPNENIIQIEDVRPKQSKRKRRFKGFQPIGFKRTPLVNVIFSVLLAIIVGTGFGVTILTMITTEETQAPIEAQPVQSVPKSTVQEPVPNISEKPTEINVSPLLVTVIQGGRFSSIASGQAVANQLQNSGYAAVLREDSEFVYVFIGIGLQKAPLEAMSDIYTATGQETYVKEGITIKGRTYVPKTSSEANYIKESRSVFEKLMERSSSSLAGEIQSDEEWAQLTTEYNSLPSVQAEQVAEPFKQYAQNIDRAYLSLETFRKTSDQSAVWQAQQALLDAFISYEQWIASKK